MLLKALFAPCVQVCESGYDYHFPCISGNQQIRTFENSHKYWTHKRTKLTQLKCEELCSKHIPNYCATIPSGHFLDSFQYILLLALCYQCLVDHMSGTRLFFYWGNCQDMNCNFKYDSHSSYTSGTITYVVRWIMSPR